MENDKKISKLINFAESLRQKTIIYSIQLQNIINYQYSELVNKPLFSFCTTDGALVSKQFKRAFNQMSQQEQAMHYSKSMKTISQIISRKQEARVQKLINPQIDIEKMVVDVKRQGSFKKWTTSRIQIAKQFSIIHIFPTNEELDLQNYLMRTSKSKHKQSIVLQAIQESANPLKIRMANNIGEFQEFKDKIQYYIDRAFQAKVIRLLKKNRISTTTQKTIRSSINIPLDINNQPITVLLTQGNFQKSLRKIISQSNSRPQNLIDQTKIFSRLVDYDTLYNLSNFKGYEEMDPGVFYNKRQNVTRKLFVFNEFDINYEWLVTNMNCYKTFKKWKPSLFLINLLAQVPSQRTKIYHQINLYKDYTQVDYVFLRHMFQMDRNHYYIDKSIWTEQYGSVQKYKNSRGNIDYGLWRFRKIQNKIQVLIQIKMSNIKTKNIWQIASQYVGDVDMLQRQYTNSKNSKNQKQQTSLSYKTVHNANIFLFEDQSEINLDSIQHRVMSPKKIDIQSPKQQKQNEQDEQFQMKRTETKYFTIYTSSSDNDQQKGSSSQNQNDLSQQIKVVEEKVRQHLEQQNLQKQETRQTQISLEQDTKWRHIIQPSKQQKRILRQSDKGHFLWQNQWKVTEKGQVININKALIEAQSSVLKSVLSRMGRNLFSGKSILNISLPIQIFGIDTNLQRLCKCLAYAPRFLEKATTIKDPVQRIKQVICFSIGYGLLYIQMQKPFNPILGQTFQAIIDGCPVYGEQISHHPPISSIFFKGRNYCVYGNFQAKVQTGMNSASGINAGHLCISFDKQNIAKNILKFNTPPGQLSGLIYGDRKLTLIRKSYILDVDNMMLAQLSWGSMKKKNQLSNFNDYVEGRVMKLKKIVQFQQLSKLKESDFEAVLFNFKGRWTQQIFFQNQVLFDIEKDAPVVVIKYPQPLESNCSNREDLIIRKQCKWEQAQAAKQKLQQIQREDRKLRKKYQKNKSH